MDIEDVIVDEMILYLVENCCTKTGRYRCTSRWKWHHSHSRAAISGLRNIPVASEYTSRAYRHCAVIGYMVHLVARVGR